MKKTFTVRCGDAVEWLAEVPSESIDCVIIDAAYESLEKHRKTKSGKPRGTTTRLSQSKSSSNDWFEIFRNVRFPELFDEIYRVLAPDSHFYFMCDAETMFVAKPIGEAAGFKFWKPIVWDKMAIGMGYHYRARYEFVLFFEKGKRKLNNLGIPDVLAVKRVYRGYPTEKPVDLLTILIEQSTTPGEVVLDCFTGSGSTGVAAVGCGRRFVGFDLKPEAVELATKRIVEAHIGYMLAEPTTPAKGKKP